RRTAGAGPPLVISRFWISQYSWFFNRTASSVSPAALMIGVGPAPYLSTTIGAVAEPDPLGQSCPVHVAPDLNRIFSPGENVVLFTLPRDFHAVEGAVPDALSLPACESTKNVFVSPASACPTATSNANDTATAHLVTGSPVLSKPIAHQEDTLA